MQAKTERFEMRLDQVVVDQVDQWRSSQSDLPSRAEAVRRLIEAALTPTSDQLHLTEGEKLITVMLCDLYKHLKVKDGIDSKLVASAIYGGHLWALRWELSGLLHGHVDDAQSVREVVDILDMWSCIEEAVEQFSKADMAEIKKADTRFASGKFPGFDGNNESNHHSIALFMIDELRRFSRFKSRELNSHYPHLDSYRAMYRVFEPIRVNLGPGRHMSAPEVIKVLREAA